MNDSFELAQCRNVDHSPGNWLLRKRREKVGTARQDLPAGVGKHVHRFVERVRPEVQGVPSQEKLEPTAETNFHTNGGVCTAPICQVDLKKASAATRRNDPGGAATLDGKEIRLMSIRKDLRRIRESNYRDG